MRVADLVTGTGIERHPKEALPERLVFEQDLARDAAGYAPGEHDQQLVTHQRTHKGQVLLNEQDVHLLFDQKFTGLDQVCQDDR